MTNFKLAIEIGATINQTFKSAVQKSDGEVKKLGRTIGALRDQQKQLGQFEHTSAAVEKARTQMRAAQQQVAKLRLEMSKAEKPTKKLKEQLSNAEAKSERLSEQLKKQRNTLQQTSSSLSKAGVNTRQLASENTRLGASVDKLTSRYRKLNTAINARQANQSRQGELRGQIFDTVAFGVAAGNPLKIAADFELGIARLGAVTRNSTDTETGQKNLTALANKAKQLGKDTQFSAREVTSAMQFLGMAGFETNDILEATPGILDLSLASSTDLARTADIASNIMSGFGLEAKKMGEVSNILALSASSANMNLSMMGESLKFVAPLAKSNNVSLAVTAAMAGKLGDAGIQGSMAGTALRQMLLQLTAPTGAAMDAMSELGVEALDASGNLRPIQDILVDISNATQDFGGGNRSELLKDIFGTTAITSVTELLDENVLGDLHTLIAELENADQEQVAKKMAAMVANTTVGRVQRLGSALEATAINLGGLLLPAVNVVADGLSKFFSIVADLAERFPVLSTVIFGAIGGLIAFRAITLASLFTFGFLKGAVLSLAVAYNFLAARATFSVAALAAQKVALVATTSVTKLATAAQFAFNAVFLASPIGWMVVGIGLLIGAGVLLVKNWQTVKDFFSRLWSSITQLTDGSVGSIVKKILFLTTPIGFLIKAGKAIFSLFKKDDELAKAGKTIQGASSRLGETTGISTATLKDKQALTSVNTHKPSLNYQAQVTVHPAPHLDESLVAKQVVKEMDEALARKGAQERGFLFDGD